MNSFLPGTASLLEEIDKRLMVLLRDGRTLIGYLRSIDQYANLVLHQTVERIYSGGKFGEIKRGVFVIRGENVVLCGEIDVDKDTKLSEDLLVDAKEILDAQQKEREEKMKKNLPPGVYEEEF